MHLNKSLAGHFINFLKIWASSIWRGEGVRGEFWSRFGEILPVSPKNTNVQGVYKALICWFCWFCWFMDLFEKSADFAEKSYLFKGMRCSLLKIDWVFSKPPPPFICIIIISSWCMEFFFAVWPFTVRKLWSVCSSSICHCLFSVIDFCWKSYGIS